MPESQFDFDDQDLAIARNVDGIGILATFSIPETQMQDRSVNHVVRNNIVIQIINIKFFLYREKTLKQKYSQKFQ